MKILSIDTASKLCGIAILEDTNLIIRKDTVTDKSHSEKLMPLLKQVFEEVNLQLKDIDLIVCDKGPGSFTGIRIGVATCKAFSDSLNITSIGVSSLESLVYNIKQPGVICSLIDAKNDNCYYSVYNCEFDGTKYTYKQLIEPNTDSVQNIINILKTKFEKDITFVGDGSLNYKLEIVDNLPNSKFTKEDLNELNSYSLALAGLEKYLNNTSSDVLPLYLRKPQAQRQLEEKLNGSCNK